MKTFKQLKESLTENHIDVAMGRELDDEGAMIMNQIDEIKMCCERLQSAIKSPTMQIPGWVQAKVTLAADYMDSVADYMSSKNEETEKKSLGESAWTRKEGQNKSGGLNEKGRKSYERENPGSDLKAPSKKVGNPRRKSFCARMKGMRKRQKDSNNTGEDRLSKSLRAWNC